MFFPPQTYVTVYTSSCTSTTKY